MKKFLLVIVAIIVIAAIWFGSRYNALNAQDEGIKAGWAEVLNQYQRRSDLVPNLVESVKGFAEQEKDVLTTVTEARAKVSQINVTGDELLNNPQAFEQFQAAQGGLGNALSRLLVTVENYPELKSSELFRDLQAQLEGTENRITVARNRYIQNVQTYNTSVRTFPGNVVASFFGFNRKPTFTVADEDAVAEPPKVDFNN